MGEHLPDRPPRDQMDDAFVDSIVQSEGRGDRREAIRNLIDRVWSLHEARSDTAGLPRPQALDHRALGDLHRVLPLPAPYGAAARHREVVLQGPGGDASRMGRQPTVPMRTDRRGRCST